MSVKKLIAIVVVFQIFSFVSAAKAQGILPGGKSIGERLDDVGRTFRGLFTDEFDEEDQDTAQNNNHIPRPTPGKYDPSQVPNTNSGSRSGSIAKPANQNQPKSAAETSRQTQVNRYDTLTTSPAASSPDTRPGRRYFENAKIKDNTDTPENTQMLAAPSSTQSRVAAQNKTPGGSVNTPGGTGDHNDQSNPNAKPLHERLSQFRRSAFEDPSRGGTGTPADDPAKKLTASPSTSTTSITGNPATPSSSSLANEATTSPKRSSPVQNEPLSADASSPVASKTISQNTTSRPTPAKRPANAGLPDRTIVAERTSPATRLDGATAPEVQAASKAAVTKDAQKVPANIEAPASKDNSVLFARKSPVLSVETHGPRKIAVGKESVYEVKIFNSGEVAAEDLVVFVNLPEWADVISTEASIGTPQILTSPQISAPFQWKAGRLEAKSQEKLVLRIVPRQSRPFDLAVRWEFKPAASQTMIEVQEPKLEMQLEGPREVFYNKKETFRLKLFNSGTGNAEAVTIKFIPVSPGENVPATYELGVLPAGEERQIEVELTARQSGNLEIQVEAKDDTGVHAELAEKVLVRRAGLEIALDGPKLQFVGSTSNYTIRVRNPGNAPAKDINFTAALPAGLKYIGGIEGAKIEPKGNKLHWIAESIPPEAAQIFNIKCIPSAAGLSRLEVAVTADDDLTASALAMTQVESVANLAIDVKDPGGPVPVGEDAIYEIHVRNRGTKDADSIEVIAYFSNGIEPISAEGVANRLGPGQVVFSPIPSLAPGADLVLKVHARADTPGNHVFRTEMHCKALGSRLVSEDTTLYYQDALAIPQNLQARPAQDRSTIR